ncbi:GRP family sugar transporter [Staphylococcus aureus]
MGFFTFGALTYLISAQPNMNGLATGFILCNICLALISTGIYFLKQHKTSKEMVITIIGLVLILVAASVTVFIK